MQTAKKQLIINRNIICGLNLKRGHVKNRVYDKVWVFAVTKERRICDALCAAKAALGRKTIVECWNPVSKIGQHTPRLKCLHKNKPRDTDGHETMI